MSEEELVSETTQVVDGTNEPDLESSSGIPDANETESLKAENQKLSDRIKKADFTIMDTKRKLKDAEKTGDASSPEEISKLVAEEVAKNLEKLNMSNYEDVLQEELEKLSQDGDMQSSILEHYQQSIQKSGVSRSSVRSDLLKSMAIASAPQMERDGQEKTEALKAKATLKTPMSAGTNMDRPKSSEDYLKYYSPAELEQIRVNNWSPEAIKRVALTRKAEGRK